MTPDESRPIRLAEYAALRSEITTFLTLQVQIMSYSIVLGGVMVTAGLSLKPDSFEVVAFFPLPFLIFGLLYLDAKGRILRAAKYLHTELRQNLIDHRMPGSLTWELFIRKRDKLAGVLSLSDILRWAVFLVPSGVPIIWWRLHRPQLYHRPLVYSVFTIELILFVLFVLFATKLWAYEKTLCEKEN